jgi:hypothetical protein
MFLLTMLFILLISNLFECVTCSETIIRATPISTFSKFAKLFANSIELIVSIGLRFFCPPEL